MSTQVILKNTAAAKKLLQTLQVNIEAIGSAHDARRRTWNYQAAVSTVAVNLPMNEIR